MNVQALENWKLAQPSRTMRDYVRDVFDNWCCSHRSGPAAIPDWQPIDWFDDAENEEAAKIWREMTDNLQSLNSRDEQDNDVDDPRGDDEYLDTAPLER